MYDYGIVKSIHDQRMRQFMIEAERSHLIRMLRAKRSRPSLFDRLAAHAERAATALAAPTRRRGLAS